MNLPATALEFLDVFRGLFHDKDMPMPWIHCYCFSNATDIEKDIQLRAEEILNGQLETSQVIFHRVRDVAPKKVMVCLSFQLPETIGKQKMKENEHKRRNRSFIFSCFPIVHIQRNTSTHILTGPSE